MVGNSLISGAIRPQGNRIDQPLQPLSALGTREAYALINA
ncbi:hypothetical protein BN873_540004 [Candidatus Competibacter denitrificans Run_A_D11]|uniref:Uncharacterized protein n=1 Tax=Candidatus Competibacter denitrificans Run_A_D11 TaxID=1400863 RepID=W6MA29_9GAMM|nr:hypothetical protein BN873_540004 [Candidatus Competibacter denitrificans Run_A_D11]